MNKSRSTTNKQILTYLNENDYANAAKLLLKTQINEWDKLDEGYKNLSSLKTKTFWFNGFNIKMQFLSHHSLQWIEITDITSFD